jgi:general secretion pathway protein D
MKKRVKTQTLVLFLMPFFFILPFLVPSKEVGAEERKEVSLDFDDVDIRLFIRVISELTGKNFIINNKVRGKVTVLSPKKLTTEQAYEVFKSVLAVNGFTVVEAGKVTKIIPAQNMSGEALPVSTRKVLKGEDQFITQIMPLLYLDAKRLLPMLKPLLSRQATIFAPPSSDLLIVTDYKRNIRKIDRILDEIDIEIADEIIERLDLKYSPASVVSSKITQLLGAKYGKGRNGIRAVFFKILPLERINAIIAIASSDIMLQIRSIISKIDHPIPEGKSSLNVYYLENADAEDMVRILTETQKAMVSAIQEVSAAAPPQKTEAGGVVVGGKFKGPGKEISITADKSTNSLIIFARPEDYIFLRDMIKMLDIPRKQVFIETLILEASPSETFEFGTEWAAFKDVGHPLTSNARTGVIVGSKDGGALDTLLSSPGLLSLGSGFSLGAMGESLSVGNFNFPSLGVLIRAAESLRTVNILSRPQLLILNNEKASIIISENRPFETSTTSSPDVGVTQNIEYRDVGIILDITPHINEAGKIRLEISQEVSTLSGTGTIDRPITLKRVIETVVEVEDGHTVILGGLIQKQRDFSRSQTPCLGSLPFLGWAFKTVGIEDTKTNLLVFISPRVIESAKDADAVSIEKKEALENEIKSQNQEIEQEKPFFMDYDPRSKKNKKEEMVK